MATKGSIYNLEEQIAEFFSESSATREACDAYAKEHLGGDVTPVPIQDSSYSVYAGPNAELVAQFRPKSLQLNIELVDIARTIHGSLVPRVEFKGTLGEEEDGKEPLYIYVMNRIPGVSYLEYKLARPAPDAEFYPNRKTFMVDVAK